MPHSDSRSHNWLTTCSRVLIENLIVPQLVKKFSEFFGTGRFTTFIRAHHLSLPWATSVWSTPSHTVPWRSSPVFLFHLYLVFRAVSFLHLSPPKHVVCMYLLSHTYYTSHLSHPSLFDSPKNIWWGSQIKELLITILSSLLLIPSSLDQLSHSACVFPLICKSLSVTLV